MKFFVLNNNLKDNQIILLDDDVNHIKNVLRKKVDDELIICNSETLKNYKCKIIRIDKHIECEIICELNAETESKIKIEILQGLPKADKMELIIQKSVELGVHEITPIEMKRSIVKLNEKDKIKKIERWQKISEVASKQCGRDIVPKINEIKKIKDIKNDYDYILVAYEKEEKNTLKEEILKIKENWNFDKELNIAVLIGPEGGIDSEEIDEIKKVEGKIITLGKRILRTETVALSIISILMYELEM